MDNEQSRATIPNRRKASKGITTINECFMSGSYFQIVGQEKSMQKEFSSFAKLKRQGPVLRSPRWLKPMGSITRKGKKKEGNRDEELQFSCVNVFSNLWLNIRIPICTGIGWNYEVWKEILAGESIISRKLKLNHYKNSQKAGNHSFFFFFFLI